MKKIFCKLLGKHNHFVSSDRLEDKIVRNNYWEICHGERVHVLESVEIHFRCTNCCELV